VEILSDRLSLIDAMERAGDLNRRPGARQPPLADRGVAVGGVGRGDLDRERLDLRGQLRDLTREQEEAAKAVAEEAKAVADQLKQNTSEIAANTAELQRIAAFNESLVGRQVAEISRALADIVSGQLGVQSATRSRAAPAPRALARY
jgi:hypothetical protein